MQQLPKNEIPTAKPYRPNWKNIFSQLGNYFFTVKYNLTANKYAKPLSYHGFPDIIAAFF